MSLAIRRLALVGVVLGVLATACVPTGSTATPRPSPPPAATSPAATSAFPPATPAATPTPTTVPTSAASAAPSQAACGPLPQDGQLPSDRFTDLKVSDGATADRLTFVFGNPSLPGPPSPPQGSVAVTTPPYTQAGSGAAIVMIGAHVLQVRFSGMSLQNDTGQPTYSGPAEIRPSLPALRHAVMFDASEGIVGWYVGYDGSGCVSFARDGNDITLTIDHA